MNVFIDQFEYLTAIIKKSSKTNIWTCFCSWKWGENEVNIDAESI